MRLGRLLGYSFVFFIVMMVVNDLAQLEGAWVTICQYAVLILCILGSFFVIWQHNMVAYVGRRLVGAVLTMLAIATLTFFFLRFMPGGPFDQEKALPPEVKANIEAKYKLNEPVLKQYTDYLVGLAHGDLGESYKYVGRGVSDIIVESAPASFKLGFYALLISYILGIPLGIFAAWNHNTWKDTTAMFIAMSGVAMPSFVVAPILIIVFSFWMDWLPPALWESPIYYILPVVTLGIRPAAIIARLTRSSALDVIKADFVRTARAKGLSENVVMFKHVLRNSLIPVVTMSGNLIAGLLTGSFVIEVIYAVPGIAKHFVLSVTNRDYPLVLGLAFLFSVLLVGCNLIKDLLYAIIDPRIKL